MRAVQVAIALLEIAAVAGNIKIMMGDMKCLKPDDIELATSEDGKEQFIHIGDW